MRSLFCWCLLCKDPIRIPSGPFHLKSFLAVQASPLDVFEAKSNNEETHDQDKRVVKSRSPSLDYQQVDHMSTPWPIFEKIINQRP